MALLGLMWTTWTDFMQVTALLASEEVPAESFLPYAQAWFEHVISPEVPTLAGQVDTGAYPDNESTLGMQAVAIAHLVHASRTQGVDAALPEFLHARGAGQPSRARGRRVRRRVRGPAQSHGPGAHRHRARHDRHRDAAHRRHQLSYPCDSVPVW